MNKQLPDLEWYNIQKHFHQSRSTVAMKIVIVVREVQPYNYQPHSSIGPYHFWGVSPRNSTLFLNGRCIQAVYETMSDCYFM